MTNQRDYLLELLDQWRSRERDKLGGPYNEKLSGFKMPRAVKEAQARLKRDHLIVARWEARARAARRKLETRITAKFNEARKRIMFDKPEVALKFIEKL